MIPAARFFFLRHGQTEWNRIGRMQGLIDIPLNPTGEQQAERARAAATGLGLRAIASSSLSRARRTADIVNRDLGLPVTPFDELREFDVGPFEGTTDHGWMAPWRSGAAIAGVETFAAFLTRVRRGVAAALALEHPVLIVAHGGVFWAIERLLGFADHTDLPNATLARLDPPGAHSGSGAASGWRISLVPAATPGG